MSMKKNAVQTITMRQIEKSGEIVLDASQKDIAKYEKLILAYGNVAPTVVAASGEMYKLLDGHARIKAYMRTGVDQIPAVVAQAEDELEQLKLSLMMSATREQGSALSEGALIEKLVENHGQTLGELSILTQRSKAWLSKRQSLAKNLSAPVRQMVINGVICARTAEEIVRIPQREQALFAANVAKENLSKEEAARLVKLYLSEDTTAALQSAIISSPSEVMVMVPQTGRIRIREKQTNRSMATKVSYTRHLVESISEFVGMSENTELALMSTSLFALQKSITILTKLISARVPDSVYPGKRGDEND